MILLGFQKHDARVTINIFKMTLRDRYLGSVIGVGWAVIQPLILLSMYTFIFGFVFKAKMPGSESTFAFAIWLITGYVPYMAISEAMSGSSTSVVGGASLVKNIVFKTETLPMAATMLSGVPFAVGMAVLLLLQLADGNSPSVHVLALLIIIPIQFMFLAGMGFFFAATTVFVRDVSQIVPTLSLLILFFSPVFYQTDMMPHVVQRITFFNPFYQMIQPYRDTLINHEFPEPWGMLYLIVVSILVFVMGLKYFRKLNGYFEMAL